MVVCKFFLQGRCKFGSECRNYHPEGGKQDSYGGSRNQSHHQPPPIDTGRGWDQRGGGRNRFELYSSQDNSDNRGGGYGGRGQNEYRGGGYGGRGQNEYRGGGYGRRGQNEYRGGAYGGRGQNEYRGGGYGGRGQNEYRGGGYGGFENEYRGGGYGGRGGNEYRGGYGGSYRGGRGGGREQYNDRRGGGGGYRDEYRGGKRDEYRGFRENDGHQQRGERRNDQYHYYASRNQDTREDRDTGKGLFYHQGTTGKTSDQPTEPEDIALQIRGDMEEWLKGMWPLSCYAYSRGVPCLPGLVEMSPEELRAAAYTANSQGNGAAFLQSLEELVKKQNTMQQQYANITVEEIRKLLSQSRILMSSESTVAGLFGPAHTSSTVESITSSIFSTGTAPTAPPASSSASLFNNSTTAALFSTSSIAPQSTTTAPPPSSLFQSLASTSVSQQQAPGVTANTGPSQTDASQSLTQEDLEAFRADKFILGKIPEHPPPPDLC